MSTHVDGFGSGRTALIPHGRELLAQY
jgi:hypothetical protein